jgi:phage terminase large subunit-like protein
VLGPQAPASAIERGKTDKARDAANEYAKMDGEEKCAYAGGIMRRTWFARLYAPHAVERLETCRICKLPPSVEVRPCQQCVPTRRVARFQQIPAWLMDPESRGDVSTHTFMGGRGSGKTMTCNGFNVQELLRRPNMRAAYLGPDFKVSVGVGIKGRSGLKTLLEEFDPGLIWRWNDVKNILTLANGSQVNCLSSKEPGSIEGEEYHLSWLDELAELLGQGGDECIWRKRLEPGVRLLGDNGEPVRHLMSGTPEATLLIKDLHDSTEKWPEEYEWTQLATRDNIANLDKKKTGKMYREAGDSAFAQQKLEGHLILESPHALLSEADLENVRVGDPDHEWYATPEMCSEVVCVIDANHSSNKKSDECGIIVMGLYNGRAYVFADASTPGGPKAWGERIIEVLAAFPEIDRLVVEDDKSLVLDVVERVLKEKLEEIGRPIKVEPIYHNNKSKKERADPVAVLYQVKKVLLCPCRRISEWANFTLLEWQWKSWNPKDPKAKSPDRVDANVYGATYFLLTGRQGDSWHSG